jgi:hypothetical protein
MAMPAGSHNKVDQQARRSACAAIPACVIAMFRSAASDARPLTTPSATERAFDRTVRKRVAARGERTLECLRRLRTLQRRIRHWRALHGPPKEVFFTMMSGAPDRSATAISIDTGA